MTPRRTTIVLSLVSAAVVGGGLWAALSVYGVRRAPARSREDDRPVMADRSPPRAPAISPRAAPPSKRGAPPPPEGGVSPAGEAAVMEKLRGLAGKDPALIIQLARAWNNRLPDSPDAPERAWMIVKSLVDEARFIEARDEAQIMVNRYPGTSWALDVQRHLLSNPLQ